MPPGQTQGEGPSFLLGLGRELGNLSARIEALEAAVYGGQQQHDGGDDQAQHHQVAKNAQAMMPATSTPERGSPLDMLAHFAGETKKLHEIVGAIAEMKKMAQEFAPLLVSLKQLAPSAPANQALGTPASSPATTATPAQVQ